MFYGPNTSFSLRENDGTMTPDQHIVTASLLIAPKLIRASKFMALVGLQEIFLVFIIRFIRRT